jgi:hypothetical protein
MVGVLLVERRGRKGGREEEGGRKEKERKEGRKFIL